jgi:hypothetical protein
VSLKRLLFVAVLLFNCIICFPQAFTKAASNAFIITRMVEKYYVVSLKRLLFVAVLLFNCIICFPQAFTKAASNAFIITRMVEKFHIQPKRIE